MFEENRGFRYVLAVIDKFSKIRRTVPLKKKCSNHNERLGEDSHIRQKRAIYLEAMTDPSLLTKTSLIS